ncbi:GDSL esterase/lipase [Heracleum sosnowskyi]|uniref:GDSL esterase/lipase n=1 Tax=Heracleum sosnowskyi TaxID=360622 RepID=A0AAD8HDL3_9APIA|nr:GDSL esterase/lipase [Heracleum sosnowskyi]
MATYSFPSFRSLLFSCVSLAFGVLIMASSTAEARAFFVFGDSLVDSGNNNYLATTARADSPPYGIDYPTGQPTGRFSNGLNIPDLISEEIGSELTLPYLSPELNGEKLLIGANFASAGIGVLNDTGVQFAKILRMPRQLEYFREYKERVSSLVGEEEMDRQVKGGLVLLVLGGNDFVNNFYLVPYSLRVLVTGAGPLGCVPAELAQLRNNGQCSAKLIEAAGLYDPQLTEMLEQLNSELGADIFVAVNTNLMNTNFISNPQAFGFVTSKEACCGQGPNNGLGLCNRFSNLCPDRSLI